jgi:hypothetical protein
MLMVGAAGWSFAADNGHWSDIQKLEKQIEDLDYYTGPGHPTRQRLVAQLTMLRAQQPVVEATEMRILMNEIRDELASLKERMARLEAVDSKNTATFVVEVDGEKRKAVVSLINRFHSKYHVSYVNRESLLEVRGDPAAIRLVKSVLPFLIGTAPTEADEKLHQKVQTEQQHREAVQAGWERVLREAREESRRAAITKHGDLQQ